MTILVVGASGATGRLLVEQLLNRGQNVKVIVRSPEKLPEFLKNHDHLSVICASVLGAYIAALTGLRQTLGQTASSASASNDKEEVS